MASSHVEREQDLRPRPHAQARCAGFTPSDMRLCEWLMTSEYSSGRKNDV